MENIKHKFSFSEQNLEKETDVSANSECRFKRNNSTFPQIKGESIKFMRVLFFYLVRQILWIQYRYVLQEFSFVVYSSTLKKVDEECPCETKQ